MDPTIVRCTRTDGTEFTCRLQKKDTYTWEATPNWGEWPLGIEKMEIDHLPRHTTINIVFRIRRDY